jgi:hypothetical protein
LTHSDHSKKTTAKITELEKQKLGLQATPENVLCKDFLTQWYELIKSSGRVTERTLLGYKSILNLYLTAVFWRHDVQPTQQQYVQPVQWLGQEAILSEQTSSQ